MNFIINKLKLILTVALILTAYISFAWPTYVHISTGETQTVTVGKKEYQVKLEKIEYVKEPNNRKPASIGDQTLKEAKVTISVNGKSITLLQRAYQLPVEFMGLKLYVENTREWVKKATRFQAIEYFPKDAKIAIAEAGETWGPKEMHFPIMDYRWRSSTYNNTWSSLVPGTGVYYHHGEDFGLAPDRNDIQAILSGSVKATPLPNGDGASNEIVIEHDKDFSYRISHVNTGTVKSEVIKGNAVKEKQILAKSGRTYNGKELMGNPHLHINFIYKGEAVSTYPYLVEAYLRDYPENVLAIAGGILYTMAGDEIELDASRSIVRDDHKITKYSWELPDGKVIDGANAKVHFDKPGTYPVILNVRTNKGDEDRDIVQIYVLDKEKQFNDFLGYFYPTPVRVKAGDEVTIWRPWRNGWTNKPIMADFGDGSKAVKAGLNTKHKYKKPGIYTVTLTPTKPAERPTVVKMKVVVEK